MRRILNILVILAFGLALARMASAADLLPSWNDGPAKQAVIKFVTEVTDKASPKYVAPAERIAVFDNDGTLWVEQPMYTQLAFALDRVKDLAPKHSEWRIKQPFKAALEGDLSTLAAGGKQALLELVMVTHANITVDEFNRVVTEWLATAKHPRFKRPYTDLVYQPMLQLMAYLRANGFKTFIVSGGGVDFMRTFSERVYGVPPEQVIGSSIATKFELRDGRPVLVRLPEIAFIDDKTGKPVGIHTFIGRRPILAFGNSDGDLEMLQWTASGPGVRLMLIVHHTDPKREFAYDRQSHFGRLDTALNMAKRQGWVVVDMQKDWKRIFLFDK